MMKDTDENEIITTDEERFGYEIIRAIVSSETSPLRVHLRDSKSYCAILFDDNNRKPICRLRFNSNTKKYIGLFEGKEEMKIEIHNIEDIYNHSEQIRKTVKSYIDA